MLSRACLIITLFALCSGCRGQNRQKDSPHDAEPAASTIVAVKKELEPTRPSEPAEPLRCEDSPELAIFISPRKPHAGEALRAMVVADRAEKGRLRIRYEGEDERVVEEHRGLFPAWWYAEIDKPAEGVYRITLDDGERILACKEIEVSDSPSPRKSQDPWPMTQSWGRAMENFYSAWIEKLFDAPLDDHPSWKALHDVTRDKERNFLHGYLSEDEDRDGQGAISLVPDCADLPYYLRAYFAYKLELPFGYSDCTRGGPHGPPKCHAWSSCSEMEPQRDGEARRVTFGRYLRQVANVVQSGTVRASAEDNRNDFYDISLTTESLRPGTVFADPFGHVLIISTIVPQTPEAAGALFAIDGQPDGTIARKRFWRGNFLFENGKAYGSPGFKRFRPVVREGDELRALTNAEIAKHADYGDFSTEQRSLDPEGFYDRMDDALSPTPLDPIRALREIVQALDEQVRARVVSVENGRTRVRGLVEMPEGGRIFETTGPWEDFSTPSRDLRLLIAIDVVKNFPARVKRRPERFAMPEGISQESIEEEMKRVLDEEAKSRSFEYTRSDGSRFTLTLADVLERARALESAYNPNDCVELRWGAPPGSQERSTCRKRAPSEQQERMRDYGAWFRERRRPART